MKYHSILFPITALLLSGCGTNQWLNMTTKAPEDLQKYKEKTASEFIYKRYITGHDTAGIGLLYKGMDLIASGADKLNLGDRNSYYYIARKLNLHKAQYNLSNYSKLLKPTTELSNLCKAQGGSYSMLKQFTVNIPRLNLNKDISGRYAYHFTAYDNANNIAKSTNAMKPQIQITEDFGIPLLVTAQDIERMVLTEINKLDEFNRARKASRTNKILGNDMRIHGEAAFQEAIALEAFGVFECKAENDVLWRASIKPLWNEVHQDQMINTVTLQITASD